MHNILLFVPLLGGSMRSYHFVQLLKVQNKQIPSQLPGASSLYFSTFKDSMNVKRSFVTNSTVTTCHFEIDISE